MRILVIGGTRFFGKRFVELALSQGAEITVLCRSPKPWWQGQKLNWIQGDRKKLRDISFGSEVFDCVLDQVAFDAEEAQNAITCFEHKTRRYVFTSTQSVYPRRANLVEADFDPSLYTFGRTIRLEEDYGEGKRQAEAVFSQKAPWPVVMTRFPYVLGPDDYTERLRLHVKVILEQRPLFFSNPMAKISVIHAQDAAQSLWSLCQMNHQGPINLCSPDALSLSDLMGLIETATQTKWRPGRMGDERSRYDAENDAFMNSAMAKSLGIVPRTWKLWLRELIEQEVRALS